MQNNNQQSGFTLVETLVAITILLLVITGPMSISARAAKSTSFSSEQVVAFFLAQEGAEIAQKGRDDILLANFTNPTTAWNTFTNTSGTFQHCFGANGCGLELNTNAAGTLKNPVNCSGTSCTLYVDSNTANTRSRYTHTSSGNTATSYLRVIKMQKYGEREVKVTSTVYWRTGSQKESQKVEVETYLFNIYGN